MIIINIVIIMSIYLQLYIYILKKYIRYKYIFQILSTPGSVCVYIYVTFCNNPQKLFELFFLESWK